LNSCSIHNLFYAALDCLILLGVVRDWVVDKRVHKVYLYALPSLIVCAESCHLRLEDQSKVVASNHPSHRGLVTALSPRSRFGISEARFILLF